MQYFHALALARSGRAACGMMPGGCPWHIHAMTGTPARRVCLLSAPGP